MSPDKARRVIDQIRGRSYEEALMILELMPYRACYPIFKLIYSAAANASHNNASNKAELWIKKIEVQKGNTIKKLKPRARGRSYLIKRPTCHILIVLQDTYYMKRIIQNIQDYPKAFSKKEKRNIFLTSTKLFWAQELVHKKYYAHLWRTRKRDAFWEDISIKYTRRTEGEFDYDKDFIFYFSDPRALRPLLIPPRNSLKYM
uniref:Large ribosomal subunit protein uL22c n=1 Tax=Portulaca oleracea TaxID=46147 RepID=A0A2D1CNS9_POROL|nr:ribosomal protein L22 [Portulaca oleracea]ATN40621.1 ribosomal protein L22 [Portulaca oleracea]QBC69384.1 ribosomal protein L22 [Portulaca oleracea]